MCPDERAMTLTGLALQAEYGDYLGETMGRNYFIPENYFPERVVKRLGAGYIRDHAPNVHRLNSGMTQTEAEIEFIQVYCCYHLLNMKMPVTLRVEYWD